MAPNFKSGFALLDVNTGRKALAKHIERGNKVRLRVDLVIDYVWGGDDGTSQEFACTVKAVKQL